MVDNAADADTNGDGKINVVQLEGTTGAAPAIDRGEGFADAIKADPSIKVIASQTGDFTRDGGKQVMESFLQSHDDIDVLFAQNDDMGLGAIEAIEAAGQTPGKDIKIITVDAVHDGMQALSEGKINFIVECSPLLGPQLMDIAKKVLDGEEVEPRILTEETTFTRSRPRRRCPTGSTDRPLAAAARRTAAPGPPYDLRVGPGAAAVTTADTRDRSLVKGAR